MNKKYLFYLVAIALLLFAHSAYSQVFEVAPKRVKRTNGTVLTPEMSVIVTTKQSTNDPFYNGAKEIKEAYLQTYGFDYQKANCGKNDFTFRKLDVQGAKKSTNVTPSSPKTNVTKSTGTGNVFKITPKKIKRSNGTVLTPEMSIIVTTKQSTGDPFYNGAKEIKEAYLQKYGFDYQKANCGKGDFEFSKLD